MLKTTVLTVVFRCLSFCSLHLQQLSHWRRYAVGGPRTVYLLVTWAACLKRLRTLPQIIATSLHCTLGVKFQMSNSSPETFKPVVIQFSGSDAGNSAWRLLSVLKRKRYWRSASFCKTTAVSLAHCCMQEVCWTFFPRNRGPRDLCQFGCIALPT